MRLAHGVKHGSQTPVRISGTWMVLHESSHLHSPMTLPDADTTRDWYRRGMAILWDLPADFTEPLQILTAGDLEW